MPTVARQTPLLVLSLLAVAACTSDRATATSEPHGGALVSAVGAAPCDFSLHITAAQYFGRDEHPAVDDLDALKAACEAGNQGAANIAGFGALSDVGDAAFARSSVPGAPALGGELVAGVLAHMNIGTDDAADFALALGPQGMFRVRDAGTSTTGSRDGTPDWRIQATWATRTLVYGFPISIPSGGTLVEVERGRYDVNALPAVQVPSPYPALVAYCAPDATLNGTWVQHETVKPIEPDHEFLFDVPVVGGICAETNVAMAPTTSSRLFAAVGRALGQFAPADLFAQTRTKVGGVGGFSSDLSPFFVATLVAPNSNGTVVSGFVAQPRDGIVTAPLADVTGNAIRVRVLTEVGAIAMPNALVTLVVTNNNGVPAGAYLSMPSGDLCPNPLTVCVRTDSQGIATFTGLRTHKAGGYYITATGDFDGLTGTVISTRFNVKNK